MKKLIFAGFLLIWMLTLAACTSQDVKSDVAGQDSSAESSQQESSVVGGDSSVSGTAPSSDAPAGGTEDAKYTQETADGTEGAVITFMADGTFEFRPVFYDGSPSVTGTYETTDSAHILTVLDTTAHNIVLEDLGAIRLQFDGDNLIYQGTAIGETSDGAVFTP